MLSSRILLFDNASLDALLMLYICIYMNYVLLHCLCICNTHVCSSLVEEIKNIIIIILICQFFVMFYIKQRMDKIRLTVLR